MIGKYDEAQIREEYRELTRYLIRSGRTVTTMESATGGQIASLITDTEGSSAVIKGAFITYSNDAKVQQGVPVGIIEKYSVYSRETAQAMAQACRRAYGADLGIGVTGTMGNKDPQNPEASVPGMLYFAFCLGEETRSFAVRIRPMPSRYLYKMAAAKEICDRLKDFLLLFDKSVIVE